MVNRFVALLALLGPCLGGCSLFRYTAFLLSPRPPTKTVPAECDDLKKAHAAIVVFAGPETLLSYPRVQIEVFDAVSAELKAKVGGITLVDPRRVMRYQDENPHWSAEPAEKLCRVFNCDAVLLISLMEFTTREPVSIHLARGRVRADASVYLPDRSAQGGSKGGCVWRSKTIQVVYPTESPLGIPAGDDWRLRMATEKMFAAELVKSFYKHKVPKEP